MDSRTPTLAGGVWCLQCRNTGRRSWGRHEICWAHVPGGWARGLCPCTPACVCACVCVCVHVCVREEGRECERERARRLCPWCVHFYFHFFLFFIQFSLTWRGVSEWSASFVTNAYSTGPGPIGPNGLNRWSAVAPDGRPSVMLWASAEKAFCATMRDVAFWIASLRCGMTAEKAFSQVWLLLRSNKSCTCVYICTYVCVCVCVYIYIYIHIRMYIYLYILRPN